MTGPVRKEPPFDPDTESLDAALDGRVSLIQPRGGYRFSVDAVLLADFAGPAKSPGFAVDLGTGCGVVALLLLHQGKAARVAGVEIQPELAALARRNAILNHRETAFEVVDGDLRAIAGLFPAQCAGLVVANPPFHPVGAGRDNPVRQEAVARREHACELADVVRAAKHLLCGRGRACFVYPAPRLHDLFAALAAAGLRGRRMRAVHPRPGEPARLILLEADAGRRSAFLVESPLTLETADGVYTVEADAILRGK